MDLIRADDRPGDDLKAALRPYAEGQELRGGGDVEQLLWRESGRIWGIR
jgi:hypothetical protein